METTLTCPKCGKTLVICTDKSNTAFVEKRIKKWKKEHKNCKERK